MAEMLEVMGLMIVCTGQTCIWILVKDLTFQVWGSYYGDMYLGRTYRS